MAQKKKKQFVNPEREGLFTEKAQRHNMGVQEFARYVLDHPRHFSVTTIREANLAWNAKHKFKHKKKK